MEFILFTFSIIKIFLKCLRNLGKHFKPNFPIKVWKSNAFSQILFILHAKNSNAPFFGPEEVIFCKLYFNFFIKFPTGSRIRMSWVPIWWASSTKIYSLVTSKEVSLLCMDFSFLKKICYFSGKIHTF